MAFPGRPRPPFPPPPVPRPDPTPRPPPGPRGYFFAPTSVFFAACSSLLAMKDNPRTSAQGILWKDYPSMYRRPSVLPSLSLPGSHVPHSTYTLNANKRSSTYPSPLDIQDTPYISVKYVTDKKSSTHPPPSGVQDGSGVPAYSSMSRRPSTNPPPPDTQDGPSLPVNSSLELSGCYRNAFGGLPSEAGSIDTLPLTPACGAIASPYASLIFSQTPVLMIGFGVVTQIFSATAGAFARTI